MLCINNLIVKLNSFHLSINFEIHPETITAIIGPSGAGKSTLLDAISGFSSAESGTVFWGEKSLDSLAPSLRPITIVFQDNNLFPHLSVYQNVALGLTTIIWRAKRKDCSCSCISKEKTIVTTG
jgi:thiamine transport system ATP-binding protein